MTDSQHNNSYLNIDELVARARLSKATVWRLKRSGKIPFFQPGGKGSRVMFPVDAIEQAMPKNIANLPQGDDDSSTRLPGPQPNWMSPLNTKQNEQKE